MTDYGKAVEYIDGLYKFTSKNKLSHTRECLKRLGDPQDHYRYIHVAGTNGKGSTCTFIADCLRESGYRTGLFTSPHLIRINERMAVDGISADDKDFTAAFERVKALSEEIEKDGMYHPTYFEFLFLMAAYFFEEKNVDFAVFETGLGGRLDATNALPAPEVSVITSISLDHTKQLGSTLIEIAGEKAGIIKPQVSCIYNDNCPEVRQAVEAARKMVETGGGHEDGYFAGAAEEIPGVRDIALSEYAPVITKEDEDGTAFLLPYEVYKDIEFKCGYRADWQADNASLAMIALQNMKCGIRPGVSDIKRGIEKSRIPGRLQEISEDIFIDGAHNPDGIRRVCASASKIAEGRKICVVFGAMKDKDCEGMTDIIIKDLKPDRLITVSPDEYRGKSGELIKEVFRSAGYKGNITAFDSPDEAVGYARKTKGANETVFIIGSIYLAGHAAEYFGDIK